jgi:hypothetical protein
VENAITMGGLTNNQTIGFITTALGDSALKWYYALSSRDLDNKNWKVVKTHLIKSYGAQINTTPACKGISKLYHGTKTVRDYYSEVSEVSKMLINQTP